MHNLLSYFGLVDSKIRASNKDLPVFTARSLFFLYVIRYAIYLKQIRLGCNELSITNNVIVCTELLIKVSIEISIETLLLIM